MALRRGGAELMNPMPYASTQKSEKLIDELNNITSAKHRENKEMHLKQLLEIEQECEKQFLLIKIWR